MKFNYRRTIFVGFAFFLIICFWQAYDTIIPKILTDKFGMSQSISGIIMALDNILALFLLPFFGALSDKCTSMLGNRTPFIIIGTLVSLLLIFGIAFADNLQHENVSSIADVNSAETRTLLYEYDYQKKLITSYGDEFNIRDIDKQTFLEITDSTIWESDINGKHYAEGFSPYTNYVVPAMQAYANNVTRSEPLALIIFISVLLLLLVAMSIFRSPAVALMPDVTPKPLRSKGNAVINLMGAVGGILVLVLGIFLGTGEAQKALMSYWGFFAAISGIMLVSLLIFIFTVKEPKLVKLMEEESKLLGVSDDEEEAESSGTFHTISKEKKISLILILASVALWYMGYNAVASKYSVYAGSVLQKDYNITLIIAQAAAILSYIPVGIISTKTGRKKAIIAGVIMLCIAVVGASFMTSASPTIIINVLFALAGIGWATINVNSFPMVVELSNAQNVGKYTGYYYTASMAAQTVTPFISGVIMDNFGLRTLFPYASIFIAGALLTMIFVKQGDSKPLKNS